MNLLLAWIPQLGPRAQAKLYALLLGLACACVQAQGVPVQDTFSETRVSADVFRALRQGGFVLYMRHGPTDNSRLDAYPQVDLNDCHTQRVLSNAGRELAHGIGAYVVQARIPVDEVVHSPLCRARDSARLAFGAAGFKLRQENLLMYSGNMTTEEKIPVLRMTRHLLSEPVPKGKNRLLVAHAPNLADLMGYFIKPEGTVAVFQPLGNDQFKYLGSIHPEDWPALLAAKANATGP
jgi:phosphohistidine phosphatase SixA